MGKCVNIRFVSVQTDLCPFMHGGLILKRRECMIKAKEYGKTCSGGKVFKDLTNVLKNQGTLTRRKKHSKIRTLNTGEVCCLTLQGWIDGCKRPRMEG